MPRPLYGAIEAGGTKFLCAAGYGCHQVIEEARIPTTTPAETLAAVVEFFERIERETGPVHSFGVAGFGPLDLRERSPTFGHLLATPKLGWAGTSVISALHERFDRPVGLDTDVNAAALAEAYIGAGQGMGSLAYITVGTGIGGGAVLNGHTLKGLLHPEMGHLSVRRESHDSGFSGCCPFHGDCLEGMASGPAILARWGAGVDEWADDHPGLELLGGYLGQLAAAVALLLSCERVIFGGGVMRTGRLLPYIRSATLRRLNGYLPLDASSGLGDYIVAPGLGERSGLMGAMLLAVEAGKNPVRSRGVLC